LAILNAIEYQNTLGLERKAARLQHLQHYWTSQLRGLVNVIINTPAELHRHGGIGNVGIEGLEPAELAERLMNEHGIYTAAINRPGVRGVRVTPNVYTTKGELNALVSAIKTISA
jgi:selenocysteine lyase/cysteine desulfurase